MDSGMRLLPVTIVVLGLVLGGCSAGDPTPPPDAGVHELGDLADDEPEFGTVDRGSRGRPWWKDPEVVAALDLSDNQVETIGELMVGDPELRTAERRRERHAGLSFLRALNQDPYDSDLVERRSEALTEILSDTHHRRVANLRALRDILSHEQWMKLWEVAPQALQVGRFRVTLGPRISVTDGMQAPAGGDEVGEGDPEAAG